MNPAVSRPGRMPPRVPSRSNCAWLRCRLVLASKWMGGSPGESAASSPPGTPLRWNSKAGGFGTWLPLMCASRFFCRRAFLAVFFCHLVWCLCLGPLCWCPASWGPGASGSPSPPSSRAVAPRPRPTRTLIRALPPAECELAVTWTSAICGARRECGSQPKSVRTKWAARTSASPVAVSHTAFVWELTDRARAIVPDAKTPRL
mmetsp:Transcript_10212/g.26324  ORF Transcript_10212/g.26324 Transcript_10212/m.26324 type:complete len:203 (+) Transcript_10212:313-921(+)